MQPNTVREALEFVSADKVRAIYEFLGGSNSPKPKRKDDLLPTVSRMILSRAKAEWKKLSAHGKQIIQETVHDPCGELRFAKFNAKHGKWPEVREESSPFNARRRATGLNLFLFTADRRSRELYMPRDLQAAMQAFVPEPEPPAVPSSADLPPTVDIVSYHYVYKSGKSDWETTRTPVPIRWRNMESTAKAGLLTVLALIDEGKVSVSASTQRPSAAAMKRIADTLAGGDHYASDECEADIGPIQAFAWPMLIQAGRLAKRNGSRLELTAAGRKALSTPPHETIKLVWEDWLDTKIIDELSRVKAIKGQQGRGKSSLTPPLHRRSFICEALAMCSPGDAVSVDGFADLMVASDLVFQVTRHPGTLYASDSQYGRFYGLAADSWSVLQDRYMVAFLFEYAATLGLIDVAYIPPHGARQRPWEPTGYFEGACLSRYDGLRYFRLTPLGEYCLELTDTYRPGATAALTPLSVFADLRIVIQEGGEPDAEERAFLSRCADEEEPGSVWRLSAERILLAIESGLEAASVKDFLQARDQQPLPEFVEGFLSGTEARSRAVRRAARGSLFLCDSAATADTLLSDKAIAKQGRRTGDTGIFVPAKSEKSFLNSARKMGFGFDNRTPSAGT